MLEFSLGVRDKFPVEEIERLRDTIPPLYNQQNHYYISQRQQTHHLQRQRNSSFKSVVTEQRFKAAVGTCNATAVISPSEALHQACLYDNADYGTWLLRTYQEECLNTTGCCPMIHAAVTKNCHEIVSEIITQSQDLSFTQRRDKERCTECFQRDYINWPGCTAIANGRTALHKACENGGDFTMIKILLNEGSCLSCCDDNGYTSLDVLVEALNTNPSDTKVIKCFQLACMYAGAEVIRQMALRWRPVNASRHEPRVEELFDRHLQNAQRKSLSLIHIARNAVGLFTYGIFQRPRDRIQEMTTHLPQQLVCYVEGEIRPGDTFDMENQH